MDAAKPVDAGDYLNGKRFWVGHWCVDTDAGEVCNGAIRQHLEPQVMKVLVYLAEHAGKVITKRELIRVLWGGVVVEDAALTRCISRLRQIMGDSARSPTLIETVPKVGYRLVASVRYPKRERDRPLLRNWAAAAGIAMLMLLAISGSRLVELDHRTVAVANSAYQQGLRSYAEYSYAENENAIVLFEQAIELDPSFGLAYAGLSNALSQRAIRWNSDDLAGARSAAARAVGLAPEQAESHRAMGIVMSLDGNPDIALDSYERSLQLDPALWQAAFNASIIYRKQLQFQMAKTKLLHVLEHSPDKKIAMGELGSIYLQLGDVEQAELWLDRALADAPVQLIASMNRAALDMTTGATASALKRCSDVLRVFGEDYDCLRVSAVAALIDDNLPAADQAFSRIVAQWPGDRYAMLGRAQVHLARGQTEVAHEIVAQVLQRSFDQLVEQKQPWADYWLIGAAYALAGDHVSAYQYLDKAAAAGHRFYLWDAIEPAFSRLQGEARFDDYLLAMNTGQRPHSLE